MAKTLAGPKIPKKAGDPITGSFTFKHKGPGGSYDVGWGLAPASFLGKNDIVRFFFSAVNLENHPNFAPVTVKVTGVTWPTDLPNDVYDCLAFVIASNKTKNPNGEGFDIAGWDDDVYEQQAPGANQFTDLTASYT